ncbi:MAG: hypothetical protein HY909_16930 [Deltaproteobacteria bacterium]|nr:hypothetical protein [Deltaproteobacteria bacterium]
MRNGVLLFQQNVIWSTFAARTGFGSRFVAGLSDWRSSVRTAQSVEQLRSRLAPLGAVLSVSTQESWRARRIPWLGEVNAASSERVLAQRLLELEGAMLSDVMRPDWGRERAAWAASLSAV